MTLRINVNDNIFSKLGLCLLGMDIKKISYPNKTYDDLVNYLLANSFSEKAPIFHSADNGKSYTVSELVNEAVEYLYNAVHQYYYTEDDDNRLNRKVIQKVSDPSSYKWMLQQAIRDGIPKFHQFDSIDIIDLELLLYSIPGKKIVSLIQGIINEYYNKI